MMIIKWDKGRHRSIYAATRSVALITRTQITAVNTSLHLLRSTYLATVEYARGLFSHRHSLFPRLSAGHAHME